MPSAMLSAPYSSETKTDFEMPISLVPVRRRANPVQGQALESLGHAVEYLIDSRMWHPEESNPRDNQEAIQILMRLSRAVFAECPEVVSMRQRFSDWVASQIG